MNPRIFPALAALLLSALAVSATNSRIIPETVVVTPDDVKLAEFCVTNAGSPKPGVGVDVQQVCRDLNHVIGCQAADTLNPASLSVVALDAETGADGCADLQLVSTGANGTYYFAVSGSLGGAEVTRETGMAVVPEFGTVAAALSLVLAGALVWRRSVPEKAE